MTRASGSSMKTRGIDCAPSESTSRRQIFRCCCGARIYWGYKHYADDVVDEFVNRAIGNGIDIIRIFDALNDTRKPRSSRKGQTKKYGGHAQGCVS
ncbi:MAG: hypothetical protein ACOX4I_09395 [Anaerovoracaceae bacterium]